MVWSVQRRHARSIKTSRTPSILPCLPACLPASTFSPLRRRHLVRPHCPLASARPCIIRLIATAGRDRRRPGPRPPRGRGDGDRGAAPPAPPQPPPARASGAGRGGEGEGGAQAEGGAGEPVGGDEPARGPDVAADEVLGRLEGLCCRWRLGEKVTGGVVVGTCRGSWWGLSG